MLQSIFHSFEAIFQFLDSLLPSLRQQPPILAPYLSEIDLPGRPPWALPPTNWGKVTKRFVLDASLT